jgi:hypothetical protein
MTPEGETWWTYSAYDVIKEFFKEIITEEDVFERKF